MYILVNFPAWIDQLYSPETIHYISIDPDCSSDQRIGEKHNGACASVHARPIKGSSCSPLRCRGDTSVPPNSDQIIRETSEQCSPKDMSV